jgi:Peptidase family M23
MPPTLHGWLLRPAFVVCTGLIALSAGMAETVQNFTPLLLAVQDAPVPFNGSDGRMHLVYELWITNFSSGDATVEKVDVLGDGTVLQTLDSADVAGRLQLAGSRESSGTMAKGTQGLLFLHVVLDKGVEIPRQLSHRLTTHVNAAPPGFQEMTESGGTTKVNRQAVVRIGPPLAGDGFISADSCCDATRHTRAALPVNGRVWVAQRYAVDWEQMDASGRIYAGPREDPKSYMIFGKPVLAVADATVVGLTDGLPEQTPGKFPSIISLDEADGNSVILDLGEHRYAMYAHMQPGSIKVRLHERVKRGQVIGLVGNSGNSVAPHLHFQVMDQVFSLASNGLPYEIDEFQVTGKTPGTAAFDDAESKGTPVAITAFSPAERMNGALPLDQLVVSFAKQ